MIETTPPPVQSAHVARRSAAVYTHAPVCGPGRRRRMMAALDGFLFLRVLPPLASTPVGLHGCRPPAVRPSPPPIGWLTGFIDVPRLCGLRPRWRLRPALPRLSVMCSALPIAPIVARHSLETRLTSPDGRVICAHLPSRAVIVIDVPALRPSWPPRPG